MGRSNAGTKLDGLVRLLAAADETYARLPQNLMLDVERVAKSLPEHGPRQLKRKGPGLEFFEAREYVPDVDDRRRINARISARLDKEMVVDYEAEIRHHIYLWRDASPSMEFSSLPSLASKKTAAEIMAIAMAKHLARNDELVGMLDGRGVYRGGNSARSAAHEINNVAIATGDNMPGLRKRLPPQSTVILFSDFFSNPDELAAKLGHLAGHGIDGFLVMVLDPEEINFSYRGHTRFHGLEGEGRQAFRRAESMREAYRGKLSAHIDRIAHVGAARGFPLIVQRTDRPLHEALMAVYGLMPPGRAFDNTPAP